MRLEKYFRSENCFDGIDTEAHCLGRSINWEEKLKENNINNPEKIRGFKKWTKIIRNLYPEKEAIDPKPKWSTDLFDMVINYLGLDQESIEDQGLKFYNTTGSVLDKMGVDAMFVYNNPITNKESMLTIDITKNPNKDQHKADIIISDPPIRQFMPNKEYQEKMNNIARNIARRLKEKSTY